jgi:hypothetical protein
MRVDTLKPLTIPHKINVIDIIATEAKAALRYVLPSMITWIWRKYICHEIQTIPLQATIDKVTKVAYLNIHGNIKDKNASPVLFSHGDHSHPCTLLHLADIAQKAGQPTFSLYIPGVDNNEHVAFHDALLKQAIDQIESLAKDKFIGILGVGHSKGAILLAQREFVALDPRIKATCSIAGRLNILNESDTPDKDLITIVKTIYEGILKHPEKPLMQIIPREDWNAPYEAMAVRPHQYCYLVPGMHLSGLYSPETREHFSQLLNNQ